MDASRNCRLFALQCFRWAAAIDDATQHLVFAEIAREWLDAAKEIERAPAKAHEAIRARLH
jgi:hypothetical protein